MAIRIQSSADVGSNGIKMMIYGQWGSGKTPLLATAPGVIIGSAENGLLSLKKVRPPVPYVELRGYRDLIDFYNWLAQSQEAQQFFSVGLDSLSEIVEVLFQEEVRKVKDPRKAYYSVQDPAVSFCRAVRDLPGRHVMLLAKEEYVAGKYLPAMPGNKLGEKLPYFFDEVFRLVSGKDQNNQAYRILCTQDSQTWQARDRSGELAEYEQPDLTAIFKKILGYK